MGLVRAARPARRRGPIAVALGVVLGVALLAGLVAAVAGRPFSPAGPVYTVAEVRAGLTRQGVAGAGRTLLVRGVAAASSWAIMSTVSGVYEFHLCDVRSQFCPLAGPNGATVHLTLIDDSVQINPRYAPFILYQPKMMALNLAVQPVTPNPLIALARRLPPLARFLPTQGQVPGGVSHLYRIRLRPASSGPCAGLSPFTCATGVLVDAQP